MRAMGDGALIVCPHLFGAVRQPTGQGHRHRLDGQFRQSNFERQARYEDANDDDGDPNPH